MRRTGIFYYYQQGERLRDFPQSLGSILERGNVYYYDAVYELSDTLHYLKPISEDLLDKVHSKGMIERVKRTGDYESALYSAGGTVQAAELIWKGEIDNAFVFTGYGDHHAGRDRFGGGCYFNGAALAIAALREKGMRRFAIGDTDPHHGDGTWDIFKDDENVLYVCFCSSRFYEQNNNVNIKVPLWTSDEEYLGEIEKEFIPRVLEFKPELVFWNYGYDGTLGEYGNIGLTKDCHPRIAELFKGAAERVCHGRIIVVLCGGYSREIASYTIPKIISHLYTQDVY